MAATESYTFNVHAKAIEKMFNDETVDIRFTFPKEGNQSIGAHTMLLSAISPVFAAMFNGSWKESKITEVPILDASFTGFSQFLRYFYWAAVTINGEAVAEMVNLANKYNLPDLMTRCSLFLSKHLNEENAVDCLGLARKFEFQELTTKSKELIACKTSKVMQSQSFLTCNQDVLHEFLRTIQFAVIRSRSSMHASNGLTSNATNRISTPPTQWIFARHLITVFKEFDSTKWAKMDDLNDWLAIRTCFQKMKSSTWFSQVLARKMFSEMAIHSHSGNHQSQNSFRRVQLSSRYLRESH